MCIIVIAKDRYITDDELTNCFQNNVDGAGIAWSDGEKVIVRKGFMNLSDLISFYNENPIPLPHVLHCRTATSGDVIPEMTHPFKVSPLSELAVREDLDCPVLFHNGVIPEWKSLLLNMVTSGKIPMMPKGQMNDTRVAAIMAALPTIGDDVLEILSGKFVVIQPDGTITRWGNFEESNGIYASNDGYKRTTYVYRGCNNKNKSTDKGSGYEVYDYRFNRKKGKEPDQSYG